MTEDHGHNGNHGAGQPGAGQPDEGPRPGGSQDRQSGKGEFDRIADEFNDVLQGPKQKMVAGVLGIILGGLGIHNFYLGNNQRGLIQLGVTVVGVITSFIFIGYFLVVAAWIWGVIEGVFILTDREGFRTDAEGNPLV